MGKNDPCSDIPCHICICVNVKDGYLHTGYLLFWGNDQTDIMMGRSCHGECNRNPVMD